MSDQPDPATPTPATREYVIALNTDAWAAVTALYGGDRDEAWRILFDHRGDMPELCMSVLGMFAALLASIPPERAERFMQSTGLWLARGGRGRGPDGV